MLTPMSQWHLRYYFNIFWGLPYLRPPLLGWGTIWGFFCSDVSRDSNLLVRASKVWVSAVLSRCSDCLLFCVIACMPSPKSSNSSAYSISTASLRAPAKFAGLLRSSSWRPISGRSPVNFSG